MSLHTVFFYFRLSDTNSRSFIYRNALALRELSHMITTYLLLLSYQIILLLSTPIIFFYICLRWYRGKKTLGSWQERCGFMPQYTHNGSVIWFHAASVGEVLSLEYLIRDIKQKNPTIICYVTCGTIAGKTLAQKNNLGDVIAHIPFDFILFLLIAFKRIGPSALIIVEAEWWPGLLLTAYIKQVPLYALSARLRNKSLQRYQFMKKIIAPILRSITHLYAQTDVDGQRFLSLGIATERITTLGDLKIYNVLKKYEMVIKKNYNLQLSEDPIILVGSLHPGELSYYLESFLVLRRTFPTLKLILTPRHFNWQETLVKTIRALNIKYTLWTEYSMQTSVTQALIDLAHTDILIVCKLGELFDLYQLATLYCLGGTFVPVGGHNLLEPAVWQRLTIIGPYHENIKTMVEQLQMRNAIEIVHDSAALTETLNRLLQHPKETLVRGMQARIWLEQENSHVTRVVETLIAKLTK